MKQYTITVNGVAYEVTVEEHSNGAQPVSSETAPVAAAASAEKKQAPVGGTPVEAPMPGNILAVKVKAGDAIKAGQVLIVLEAMKMENDIAAPCDGTVASLCVNKGDTVDAGQVLLTLQ